MAMCTAALAWTCGKSSSSALHSWCSLCSWPHKDNLHCLRQVQ